jgi:hypothetical protein
MKHNLYRANVGIGQALNPALLAWKFGRPFPAFFTAETSERVDRG